MGQLKLMKPDLDTKKGLQPYFYHVSNIVCDYIRNVKADVKEEIAEMIKESYKEFALTIDGSPVGDDAEAVCIQLIRKIDLKVSDRLLSLKLHNQKLSGKKIAKMLC